MTDFILIIVLVLVLGAISVLFVLKHPTDAGLYDSESYDELRVIMLWLGFIFVLFLIYALAMSFDLSFKFMLIIFSIAFIILFTLCSIIKPNKKNAYYYLFFSLVIAFIVSGTIAEFHQPSSEIGQSQINQRE